MNAALARAAVGIREALTTGTDLIDPSVQAGKLLAVRYGNTDVARLITRPVIQGVALDATALPVGVSMAHVHAIDVRAIGGDAATHAGVGLDVTHRRTRVETIGTLAALDAFSRDAAPVVLEAVFVGETCAARGRRKFGSRRRFRFEILATATVGPCTPASGAGRQVANHALLLEAERLCRRTIDASSVGSALDAATCPGRGRVLPGSQQTIGSLSAARSVGETRDAEAIPDVTNGSFGIFAIVVGRAFDAAVLSFAVQSTNRKRRRATRTGVDNARDAHLVYAQCLTAVGVAAAADATIVQRIATFSAPGSRLGAVFMGGALHAHGDLWVANAPIATRLTLGAFERLVTRV